MLLSFPVMDPFTIETSQVTLRTGQVLIHVLISCCLPIASILDEVLIYLKDGEPSTKSLAPTGAHFPCQIAPAEALSLLFKLSKEEGEWACYHMEPACSCAYSSSHSEQYAQFAKALMVLLVCSMK